MAGKGISINFLANVRDFLRGTDDTGAALDRVASSLDELARDGDRAGEKLETSLEGVERETEQVQASFRDMARGVETSSRNAGRDLGQNLQHGASQAKEAMKEVKQEALQNASETFSSFDGSARSLVDGVQGTFGGLVASLGLINPALLPIGILGAAAVGLISSAVQKGDLNTQEFRADVAALVDEFLNAGTTGRRSFSAVASEIEKLAGETDDSKTNLKDMRDLAEAMGVPLRDVVYAYEQGGAALDQQIAAGKERLAQLQREADAAHAVEFAGGGFERATRARLLVQQQKEYNDLLDVQKQKLDAAAQATQLAAEAGLTEWQLKADLVNQVNTAYDEAAAASSDFISKESGILNTGAYIAAMQAREKALQDYQATLAASSLSPEARKFLESQGQDSAAAFLAGYKKATPAQKAELNRIWTEAAQADSGAYTDQLAESFQNPVVGPSVVPQLDTAQLEAALRAVTAKPLKVTVQLVDTLGRKIP